MRKVTFCICKNKGADQLCSNQHLCFCHMDSTIPLLSKSKISCPLAIFFACTARFVSHLFGNHIVGFLMTRLISVVLCCVVVSSGFSQEYALNSPPKVCIHVVCLFFYENQRSFQDKCFSKKKKKKKKKKNLTSWI